MRTQGQRKVIERLRDSDMPTKGNYTLDVRPTATRMTLMNEAVEKAGIEEATEVPQVFFEDEMIVAIDLSGVSDE